MPYAVWLLIVGANGAMIVMTAGWLRHRGTRDGIAVAIERERALRVGALRGVLEVGESGALGRHAATAMAERLDAFGVELVPEARRVARMRGWRFAGGALLAAVALGGIGPFFSDGLLAVLLPMRAWNGTLLPPIAFDRLPIAVLRGETLRLDIRAPGRSFVTLQQRLPGEGWRADRLLVKGSDGLASTIVGPVIGDLRLVASDGRASTDTVVVRVTDRPFVGGVAMRAVYPAYLGRAPEGLPVGEPVRVPYGTVVELSGQASTELRSVQLVNSLESIALSTSGHAFSGRFDARLSGTWNWQAMSGAGPIADLPLPLELEVVPDSVPRVEIVTPSSDTLVMPTDQIVLRMTAADDHGLTRVDLLSWRVSANKAEAPTTQRLAEPRDAVWSGSSTIELSSRGLQPGDVLHVKVVATDNAPLAQRGESRELLLRVATIDERRELARATGDSAAATAKAITAAERALEQRTQEAARARGDRSTAGDQASASNATGAKSDMSYDAAEKTRALAKDQRALTDQVKQLGEAAKTLEEQLKSAGALDSSLARELQDAQALLRDAITPDLLAQMQKLENASHQLSREEAQASLKDLQEMQRRLREQLEKSAEMLRRAALEGTMQTLGDQAKDLAAKQQQMADSARTQLRPQPTDSASRGAGAQQPPQTAQMADRTEQLAGAMQKLEDKLTTEHADAGASRTEQARQLADSSQTNLRAAGKTGASQPNAGGGSPSQTQSKLDTAAKEMQQAAQSMQDARSAQVQEWKKELTSELDQAIQETLQMSREETGLEQKARADSAKPEDVRGQQSAVKQGLDQTAQRLQEEAQKSSLLSGRSQRAITDAQQKVDQATQQITRQQSTQAASSMGAAAEALNQAAASLARDREHANASSSATGFAEMMQQLQEMANKQGAINSQALGLLPVPGTQPTSAQQGTARALARQQRELAQQLEDLGDAAGGDRAAKLAQEARQLADALDGGRIDAATVARQQELFGGCSMPAAPSKRTTSRIPARDRRSRPPTPSRSTSRTPKPTARLPRDSKSPLGMSCAD